MQRIDTEISINAPRHDVWTVLTDFGNYADWNPWIQEARGDAMVGRNLSLSFHVKGRLRHYWGKVVRAESPEVLRWRMNMMPFGLLRAEFRFRMRQRSRGGTMLYHSAIFGGPLEPFFSARLRAAFMDGATLTNRAIKRSVERRATDMAG